MSDFLIQPSLIQTRSAMSTDRLELCLFQGMGNENGEINAIRGKLHDGLEHWSVYDFISIVFGNELGCNHSRTTFYNIRDGDDYGEEVKKSVVDLIFKGQGQRPTPTMTLPGLLRLLAILPGKIAKEYRTMASNTIMRVMAGDRSLIKTIDANAESAAPLQQAFRDALEHEPADDTLEEMAGISRKKRKLSKVERMSLSLEVSKCLLEDDKQVKACFDSLLHQQRLGVISMNEYNMLKRKAMLDRYGGVKSTLTQFCLTNGEQATLGDAQSIDWVKAYVPCIDPFYIFFSAVVNNIFNCIRENHHDVGTTSPIKVRVPFSNVVMAYHSFYKPFLVAHTDVPADIQVNVKALVPTTDDSPSTLRLKQLLLVQPNPMVMSCCGLFGFKDLIISKFSKGLIDISAKATGYRCLTFTVLDVKKHLQTKNFHDDYDEIVDLPEPVGYNIIGTSSSIYW